MSTETPSNYHKKKHCAHGGTARSQSTCSACMRLYVRPPPSAPPKWGISLYKVYILCSSNCTSTHLLQISSGIKIMFKHIHYRTVLNRLNYKKTIETCSNKLQHVQMKECSIAVPLENFSFREHLIL